MPSLGIPCGFKIILYFCYTVLQEWINGGMKSIEQNESSKIPNMILRKVKWWPLTGSKHYLKDSPRTIICLVPSKRC